MNSLLNANNMETVMVLTVQHPYDTVEVLGVFTDEVVLKDTCLSIIYKESVLIDDIRNLHIYRCQLNQMIGEFYPYDYDEPDGVGTFLENQKDICNEILGEDFLTEMIERQR